MPSQILLFSQPRTGCHLLERMLIPKQTGVQQLYHPFQHAMLPLVEFLNQCTEKEVPAYGYDKYAEEANLAIGAWREALTEAEKGGEILYMHTHCLMTTTPARAHQHAQSQQPAQENSGKSNLTLIPDDLLLHPGTIPVFTIRDPMSTVPSTYRVMSTQAEYKPAVARQRELYIHSTNLGWNRELYDWYLTQGIKPLVVDANDYMTNHEYVRSLCRRLGLNPDQIQSSWPAASKEEIDSMHPVWKAVQQTLINSEGMRPDRASSNRDLGTEMGKWKDEFGEDVTALLEECVAASMSHYEYLQARKFRG